MAVQLHNKYVLGEFEFEPDKSLLKHHNEHVHLPELPFQVLLYLVENRERYVGRQNPFIDSTIALAYAEAGKRAQAIRQLDKVKKEFKPPQSPRGLPTAIALVYSVLG